MINNNNCFAFINNKKAQPFDTYLHSGYRQVTIHYKKYK